MNIKTVECSSNVSKSLRYVRRDNGIFSKRRDYEYNCDRRTSWMNRPTENYTETTATSWNYCIYVRREMINWLIEKMIRLQEKGTFRTIKHSGYSILFLPCQRIFISCGFCFLHCWLIISTWRIERNIRRRINIDIAAIHIYNLYCLCSIGAE